MFKFTSIMNQERIDEAVVVMCKKIRMIYYGILGGAFVIFVIMFLVKAASMNTPTSLITIAIYAVGLGIIGAICKRTITSTNKRFADRLMDQIRSAFHADAIERIVTVDGDRMFIEGSDKEFWLTDLDKWYETEHMYVIILKGDLSVWIEKDPLEGGTKEDFLRHVKQYTSKVTA